jgi:hypothetical protein
MINQLFREQPSKHLVYSYIKAFGLAGLNDWSRFTKKDMCREGTVNKIQKDLIEDLKNIYIRCKARSYLTDMDENVAITVLRQLLRTQGYAVTRHSTTKGGDRVVEYSINKAAT